MNSLLAGTRKPTMDELVAISEAYNVSINYLLTGDEMFPSLHQLKKKDVDRILEEIEDHLTGKILMEKGKLEAEWIYMMKRRRNF